MRRFLIVLVLILALGGFVTGQQGKRPSAPPATNQVASSSSGDDQTLSVNVDLVNILFPVVDRKTKRFVRNLKKEDFKVFEDDKAQAITNFTSESDLPLTMALLVDTSGSIRDKLKFEEDAAIEFFYSTLQRGKDKALLISFDSCVDLLQDFTDDPEKLANEIRKIRAGGGTSLYDAVYLAVNKKLSGQGGRRIVILITDGDDNSSRISLTEALESAQRNDTTIYSISTNSTAFFGSKEQERGDKTLQKFSDETGGKMFRPLKNEDLASSFVNIREELG